jgi:hypothetical protein
MAAWKGITIARPTPISLALFVIIFPPFSNAQPLASTILSRHIAPRTMALPPRAYAERQQLSPIRVDGVIQIVSCENNCCHVKMLIESVKRNASARPLAKGDIVTIIDVEARDSTAESKPPDPRQPPIIGLSDNSVYIPPPSNRTEAWLRPAEPQGDPNQGDLYQLMAGPYGFGPSLED